MSRHRIGAALLIVSLVARVAGADQIDDYVRGQMKAFHLPGVSLAILENGRIVRNGAYGVADAGRGTPASAETVYKIGSVSKQFIATAIMLLVQDGRLNIDDPAAKYLDGTPPAWRPITIRHLLTHTAGLVRESPAFDPMKATPDAEIVAALYTLPLRSVPGSKWEYSNAGYYALAEIVTRISGQPWTQFLKDRVFKPAGMVVTVPTNAASAPPNRAVGYTGNDNQQVAKDWLALRPSGAFFSTVGDLAKWDAVLDTNAVLDERSRRQMWTPVQLTDGTTYPYGFGWHVETRPDGSRVVWHGGGLPGYASYFGKLLDDRVTVVMLVNGDDVDLNAVGRGLADLYVKSRRP